MSKIKPISRQIHKFLHFSISQHIHDKRLPWQHLRTMRIVAMCKIYPHKCKIRHEKFHFNILWCYGVIKESFSGERNPPPPPPLVSLLGKNLTNHIGFARIQQTKWEVNVCWHSFTSCYYGSNANSEVILYYTDW